LAAALELWPARLPAAAHGRRGAARRVHSGPGRAPTSLAMNAAVEQQGALYKDFAVFQQVFPEVQQALKVAMGKLVKARPADPIAFLALRLREANEDIKIEKLEEEKDRKEMEAAALRIQSLGRAKQDKARVNQIKVNNGIFVREL
jgi:hypothetical protein